MARPKHLTRKEISQDRIRFLLVETWEWVIKYRYYLLGGVATVFLLGAGYWGFQVIQSGRVTAAQEELAGALKIFNSVLPGETPDQPEQERPYTSEEERDQQALREFRGIAEDQGWSSVGELAHFYVAVTQRRLKQPDASLESFRQVIDRSSSIELRNLARNHVAQLALEMGRRDEAIETWNAILDQPSTHVPTSEIMASLARTYDAAGQKAEALDLFKRLKREHPSIPDAASIEARIALLESETASRQEAEPPSEEGESDSVTPGETSG